jgi:hypothetical protein
MMGPSDDDEEEEEEERGEHCSGSKMASFPVAAPGAPLA